MAYWWVSQNRTYREESEGNYLWAPQKNKKGRTRHYWAAMTNVREGDVILSFVKQHIPAIAVANGPAYASDRPFKSKGGAVWEKVGWRVNATYERLAPPIAIPPLAKR